jgi:hypothetical protein
MPMPTPPQGGVFVSAFLAPLEPSDAAASVLPPAAGVAGGLRQRRRQPPHARHAGADGRVQGSGEHSPMQGREVVVQGVVTANPRPSLGGFFLQDGGDGDPRTSDALFVAEAAGGDYSPGARLRIAAACRKSRPGAKPAARPRWCRGRSTPPPRRGTTDVPARR